MRLRFCIDRKSRAPRIWTNEELAKFAGLFKGRVINVSGWNDEDKTGKRYKDYFSNASQYSISNIEGYMGLSGLDNELYLDLEKELPKGLEEGFEVVFCHTVLEHILDVREAFDNLCRLSNDIVIIIVPFVQPQHNTPDFGDFWRFTPQGITENFQKRGYTTLYLSVTPFKKTSKYIFAIATRNYSKWEKIIEQSISAGIISYIEQPLYCKIINAIYLVFRDVFKSIKRQC